MGKWTATFFMTAGDHTWTWVFYTHTWQSWDKRAMSLNVVEPRDTKHQLCQNCVTTVFFWTEIPYWTDIVQLYSISVPFRREELLSDDSFGVLYSSFMIWVDALPIHSCFHRYRTYRTNRNQVGGCFSAMTHVQLKTTWMAEELLIKP